MDELLNESWQYLLDIELLEALGLVFGLLAVYYLVVENILTWPVGITYILISFVIFWKQQLYGDFLLHIFFLLLNIYGWYHWKYGNDDSQTKVPVTWMSLKKNLVYISVSIVGVFLFGYFLSSVHLIFPNLIPASVPYWDAATTSLSVIAMWLTARKNIENWIYWLIVDILATGIYYYKGIHFYALLYFIYIGLAIAGFIEWNKTIRQQKV